MQSARLCHSNAPKKKKKKKEQNGTTVTKTNTEFYDNIPDLNWCNKCSERLLSPVSNEYFAHLHWSRALTYLANGRRCCYFRISLTQFVSHFSPNNFAKLFIPSHRGCSIFFRRNIRHLSHSSSSQHRSIFMFGGKQN